MSAKTATEEKGGPTSTPSAPPTPAKVPVGMPREPPKVKEAVKKIEEKERPAKREEKLPDVSGAEKLPAGCQFVIDLPAIPDDSTPHAPAGDGDGEDDGEEMDEEEFAKCTDDIDELYRNNPWLAKYLPMEEMEDPEEHLRRLRKAVKNRSIDNILWNAVRNIFPPVARGIGHAAGSDKLDYFDTAVDLFADEYKRLLTALRQENEEWIQQNVTTSFQLMALMGVTAATSANIVVERRPRLFAGEGKHAGRASHTADGGFDVKTTPLPQGAVPVGRPSDDGSASAPGLGLEPGSSGSKPPAAFNVDSFFSGQKIM